MINSSSLFLLLISSLIVSRVYKGDVSPPVLSIRQCLRSLGLQLAMVSPLNFNVDVHERCIKIGPWGGVGACNFDVGGSVSQITRVRLHTGIIVDSFEVSYVVDGNNVETRLGGTGGDFHYTFELLPGEYINSMVGSVKYFNGETCIAKLGFTTNFGKKHGPFGHGGGVEFTVPVVDGRIVAFFGQFDKYLNGIGVYLAPNQLAIS